MDKDEVLKASRRENKNRDLAELEVTLQAGNYAARTGALVCCIVSLLSSLIARVMPYSPWIIYFSIICTQWLVRFIRLKRKSDLILAILFLILTVLALLGYIRHLSEVVV